VSLRPLNAADASAVLELLAACDLADLGEVDVEIADIEEEWAGRDLERDGRFEPGVAYALRGDHQLYVHPNRRGEGYEEQLLELMDSDELDVPDRDRHLAGLLARRGYKLRTAVVRMGIDLAQPPPRPRWPDGFAARPFRPGADEDAVHPMVVAAMREIGGRERTPEPSESSVVVESPDGDVAAAALVELWDRGARGCVRRLAVSPDHRGLGLGAATLSAALQSIRAAGAGDAVLGVHEHNATARRLYEGAGMTMRFRVERWARS
jgi:mycothiol synthase